MEQATISGHTASFAASDALAAAQHHQQQHHHHNHPTEQLPCVTQAGDDASPSDDLLEGSAAMETARAEAPEDIDAAEVVPLQEPVQNGERSPKKRRRRKSDCNETELFTCPAEGCTKRFASHAGLYLHKRSKHPEIVVARQKLQDCADPHICPVAGCGKSFVSAGGLCLHRQSKHPDIPNQPRGRKRRPFVANGPVIHAGAITVEVAASAHADGLADCAEEPEGSGIRADSSSETTVGTEPQAAIASSELHADGAAAAAGVMMESAAAEVEEAAGPTEAPPETVAGGAMAMEASETALRFPTDAALNELVDIAGLPTDAEVPQHDSNMGEAPPTPQSGLVF
jgi:hypothetical protein